MTTSMHVRRATLEQYVNPDLDGVDTYCLTKNNYNDARCQDAVKALYECCDAFYRRYGDDASSPSCPQPKLLRLKMQQQKEGK